MGDGGGVIDPENVTKNNVPVFLVHLTLCLPVSSADNLGKQFGPRSGPTNRRA